MTSEPNEPASVHVPGSSAPTFSLPGFWHSLPSLLLRGPGSFSKFFRHLLSLLERPPLDPRPGSSHLGGPRLLRRWERRASRTPAAHHAALASV